MTSIVPALSALVSLTAPLNAKDDPIVTDRPDFTESSVVVPRHRLQLESGFTYSSSPAVRSWSGPEILFRYGLDAKSELRLGLPNRFSEELSGLRSAGWSDPSIGMKWQLGPMSDGLDVALIASLSMPTGERGYSSDAHDPELKLCASKDLTSKTAIAGMLFLSCPAEDGERNTTLQATLSFAQALGEKHGMFIEYAGAFPKRGEKEHLLHTGFTHQPNANSQWDIHFGFSIDRSQRQSFIAAGYSIRF